MSSTTTSARRARRNASHSSSCSPKQQIDEACGTSIVLLKFETTSAFVNGVKMSGREGSLPSVLKISLASTAQDMALFAIGVARKNGDYQPSSFCVRMILENALQRIS